MLSLPVRNTLYLGQTSIIPVLLVLLGCFAARGERAGGVLIGVAAALQPTVLLFAAAALVHRAAAGPPCPAASPSPRAPRSPGPRCRTTRARTGCTTWRAPASAASADGLANQSLHGALLRLGLEGPLEIGLFLLLGAAVAVLGLRRAVRYAQDGQLLLAVAITGCVAVAVSPTSWQHQLLWVLLAVVGRVGKKASDRSVWPVAVILVMTLPAKMMLPNTAVAVPAARQRGADRRARRRHVVPFLSRTSPYYRAPIPTEYASPSRHAGSGCRCCRSWRRVLTRPNLLLELLLIRVGYSAYQQVRLAATGGTRGRPATAEDARRQIHSLERWLHIDIEHWVNHAVVQIGWLKDFFDYYYDDVPLHRAADRPRPCCTSAAPRDYRWARSALGFATLVALLGFWLYPLAPPRLMPGLGFIDTRARRAGLLQAGLRHADRADQPVRGDALAALRLVPVVRGRDRDAGARSWWMKALGLLHPLFTVSAIVATGNHWVLDAVGGALVVAPASA